MIPRLYSSQRARSQLKRVARFGRVASALVCGQAHAPRVLGSTDRGEAVQRGCLSGCETGRQFAQECQFKSLSTPLRPRILSDWLGLCLAFATELRRFVRLGLINVYTSDLHGNGKSFKLRKDICEFETPFPGPPSKARLHSLSTRTETPGWLRKSRTCADTSPISTRTRLPNMSRLAGKSPRMRSRPGWPDSGSAGKI